MPPMTSVLRNLVSKPKSMPPIDETLAYATMFHQQNVCSATFDLRHQVWLWDRTYPRGVIVLQDSPDSLAMYFKDRPLALDFEKPQTEAPRTIVLEFLEGTRSLPQIGLLPKGWTASSAAAAAAGHGSPTCGHTDVLIPAPDQLLCSPSHPLYPMEPAVWIPFAAVAGVDHFITPYHRGLFGTLYSQATTGPVQLSATPRGPLFTPSQPGPFLSAVYFGSVVSCTVSTHVAIGTMEEELQGVVVLTYVKQHRQQGREWLHRLAARALGSQPEPPAVTNALNAMPLEGPVPYLAIWPLQQSEAAASSASSATCWQQLAPEGSTLRHVRSSAVTRVWKATELGALGQPQGQRVAKLVHRACLELESQPLKLDNPAQPTQLRIALLKPHVQRAVEEFVRTRVVLQDDGHAGSNFLRLIRQKALGAFPISSLLTARAVINCAQPLALPGQHSNPTASLSTALSSTLAEPAAAASKTKGGSSSKRKPSARTAAIEGQARASQQALAESCEPGDEQTKKATNSARRGPAQRSATPAAKRSRGPNAAVPASSSEMAPLDDEVETRAKEIFMQLTDCMQPEHQAPLSGTVWTNWMSDQETPYSATLGGTALITALDSWKEVLWEQLKELDEQLYRFLHDQAAIYSTIEQVVQELGERGGCKGAEWRRSYKDWQAPGKAVQLLWTYTKGVKPAAKYGSIFSMHCKGVWHGTRFDSGYDVDDSYSRSENHSLPAAAAAVSTTPKSRAHSKTRTGKRASASSVTTAHKEDHEEAADQEAPIEEPEEGEADVDLTTAAPAAQRNKRQKKVSTPPTVTVTALAADATPHTSTRAGKRAAAPQAATTASATLASAVPITGPASATQPAAPTPRTRVAATAARTVAHTAAAAELGTAELGAASGSSGVASGSGVAARTLAPSATVPAVSNDAVMVVSAVMEAMRDQRASFLAAQERIEERAEASQRRSEEAHREIVRLAQSGQQSVLELVRILER